MTIDAILIKENDNVATALRDIEPGETVVVGVGEHRSEVRILEHIEYGHKFAARDIPKGGDVLKYGETIGRATRDIQEGAHAHVHNIESLRGRGDLSEGVNPDV